MSTESTVNPVRYDGWAMSIGYREPVAPSEKGVDAAKTNEKFAAMFRELLENEYPGAAITLRPDETLYIHAWNAANERTDLDQSGKMLLERGDTVYSVLKTAGAFVVRP